jgi:predicted DNA-binding ribbon-helix-helix protein
MTGFTPVIFRSFSRQFGCNDAATPKTELERFMRSSVVKRSIVVGGHKTSVSLEDIFWSALKDIASEKDVAVSTLVDSVDKGRNTCNLSSALRQYAMQHFFDIATAKKPSQTVEIPANLHPCL